MSGGGIMDLLWGRLPRLLLSSGLLADSKADRTELLVLMGILAHCNEQYESNPGMELLARCAGITVRAARNAVKRLEERGIIAVNRGGGRGRTNQYRLKPELLDFLISFAKAGSKGQPSLSHETRKSKTSNPEVCALKTRSPELPMKRRKEEKQQQGGAAAGGVNGGVGTPDVGEHPKVKAVLDRVGLVGAAARAEVAGLDGIEFCIEDLGKRAIAPGVKNPAGLLRELVRDEAPAQIALARQAAAAKTKNDAVVSADIEHVKVRKAEQWEGLTLEQRANAEAQARRKLGAGRMHDAGLVREEAVWIAWHERWLDAPPGKWPEY